MTTATSEYRVVWKNKHGKEEYVTLNQDYHPLTKQEADEFAEGRRRHSDYLGNTDVKVESRQIIISDWQ